MDASLQLRTVTTAVIFNLEGYILLQKREDNKMWGLPGGGVEAGESLTDSIIREVKEETGLVVAPVRLVGVYSDPNTQIIEYADGRLIHCIALCFECSVSSGTLTLSNETEDLRYFDPNSLPINILPNHPIRIQDALNRAKSVYVR